MIFYGLKKYNFFTCSTLGGYLYYFQLEAITNKLLLSILVHDF